MFRGYAKGYRDGVATTEALYERQVAVLTEQLADARALAQAESARCHAAVDHLLRAMGRAAISPAGQREEAARAERTVRLARALAADPFEDQPIGTKGSRFAKIEDALVGPQEADGDVGVIAEE